MSGARTAVRTTRTPDDAGTPAKRAPNLRISRSDDLDGSLGLLTFFHIASSRARSLGVR